MNKYPERENDLNEQPTKVEDSVAPQNETAENVTKTVENEQQSESQKTTELPNTYAQNPNLRWQNQNTASNADNPNLRWQNQNANGQNPNFNPQNPNLNANPNFNPNFNVQFTGHPFVQQPVAENPGKGLGIAGFVLSLCSFFSCCIHPFVAFFLIIVGMVLSIVGRVQSKKAGFPNGLATAGMIISIVHAVIWILLFAFAIVVVSVFGVEFLEEYGSFYNEFAVSM